MRISGGEAAAYKMTLIAGVKGDAALIEALSARRASGNRGEAWSAVLGLSRIVTRPDRSLVADLYSCLFGATGPVPYWPFLEGDMSAVAAEIEALRAELEAALAVLVLLVVGLVLGTRAAWRLPVNSLGAVAVVGVLDMAGNSFYLLAIQTGALAVASVLSALYPVATVMLAAVVLHERVTRDHTIGIALAAAAIVLIGVGSA